MFLDVYFEERQKRQQYGLIQEYYGSRQEELKRIAVLGREEYGRERVELERKAKLAREMDEQHCINENLNILFRDCMRNILKYPLDISLRDCNDRTYCEERRNFCAWVWGDYRGYRDKDSGAYKCGLAYNRWGVCDYSLKIVLVNIDNMWRAYGIYTRNDCGYDIPHLCCVDNRLLGTTSFSSKVLLGVATTVQELMYRLFISLYSEDKAYLGCEFNESDYNSFKSDCLKINKDRPEYTVKDIAKLFENFHYVVRIIRNTWGSYDNTVWITIKADIF